MLAEFTDRDDLYAAARTLRDEAFGDTVSYSRKLFLPLTRLCRDVCHYCTFATTPGKLERPYLTIEEQLALCEEGSAQGCVEALFTLGERPEARYRAAREALAALGYQSTLHYLRASAEAVLETTGLLPHLNPGTMNRDEIRLLRPVAASMGLMLESASSRLCEPGQPHHGSPDKDPVLRLETLRLLGEENVPVTSGILIGIGETRLERIESLLALRDLHARYGHVQELIIQNFRAKANTRMAQAPEPDLEDLCWTIAVARTLLPGSVSIQAPPNLSPGVLPRLVNAGINDWGGVSPVTPDHVNPEAPWPHLAQLERETALAGKVLVQRLPVYPAFTHGAGERAHWLDTALHAPVLRHMDASALARDCAWRSGQGGAVPPVPAARTGRPRIDGTLGRTLRRLREGDPPAVGEVARLFDVRGDDYRYLLDAANDLRARRCGDAVSFVVNRNINYSNVCAYACSFCAFSKGAARGGAEGAPGRDRPYDISGAELARRVSEAWERGATEVCLQGGIHPDYTGQTYLDIVDTVKRTAPDMHVHAFSPLEVSQGAHTLGISVDEFLTELMARGLGSMPGTAAEILNDDVRQILCPDKLSSKQWLHVIDSAHRLGLPTTATIMFGHVDSPAHWAEHLLALRGQQERSGGFTEFVPLPFVAAEAPLYRRGRCRPGPTFREVLLMHAVARLVLDGAINNIQASWVKLGQAGVAATLEAGVNDVGGTLMNESITRAAGAEHGQEWPPNELQTFLEACNRPAWLRSTLYEPVPERALQRTATEQPLRIPTCEPATSLARSKAV